MGLSTRKDYPRSLKEPVFMQGMLETEITRKTGHKCTTVVKLICFSYLCLQKKVNAAAYQS